MTGLLELAELCERATGPDRNLDAMIHGRDGLEGVGAWSECPAYTGSLDAAMTLVPEGWSWAVDAVGRASCFAPNEPKPWPRAGGLAKSPALALCAAALRARANEVKPTALLEPTEAMIEAGVRAICSNSTRRGYYAELLRAALPAMLEALRSSAPQEPDDDAEKRFAELRHWFFQKLNPEQRMGLLFAAGIAPRTCDFTLGMQHEAIRIIATRLQAKAPEKEK